MNNTQIKCLQVALSSLRQVGTQGLEDLKRAIHLQRPIKDHANSQEVLFCQTSKHL